MKKTLLISGLLLALTASVASAGGINLSWNNCVAGGGVVNATFACNNNNAASTMHATFTPNVGQEIAAFEFVIDLQSAAANLPEWWKFKQTPAACRDGSMSMNTNFAGGPFDCTDPWGGTIGLQDFSYEIGAHGLNTARISGGAAVPATAPRPVDANTEYYGFALTINRQKTVGTPSCAGCLDPVCLVYNELTLFNAVGDKTILNGPDQRNYVTWQGGAVGGPGCPGATPTTKATWGKIKSIYR